MQYFENVQVAIQAIHEIAQKRHPIQLGLVLGTGLDGVRRRLEVDRVIDYADIPGFPRSSAPSHAGQLLLGRLGGRPAAALAGRFHLYEGFDAGQAAMGVRLLHGLGARTLLLTSAAGGLDPAFVPGGLMLVTDHINLTGQSPLTGPNVAAWGERFPDLSRVYDPGLRALTLEAAADLGIPLAQGVYLQTAGPQMETPAETRAFRRLGADAVGMSAALEAVAAVHLGMRVLAVNCLTNINIPEAMAPVHLEDVVAVASAASADLGRLLEAVARRDAAPRETGPGPEPEPDGPGQVKSSGK
ncbi:MAG: purine-nucleoside phosphorylase [Desulfovibrionaceae bacterium]